MQVATKIAEHVNKLTEAIHEVKTIIKDETYGIDIGDTLATPLFFPPFKLVLQEKSLESGMEEYDDVIKAMGMLTLYFSKLVLDDVYSIQHAPMIEIII